MENAAIQLEAIRKELAKVIAQSGRTQDQETIQQFRESKLIIYRYHRANVIDRNSSAISETSQESSRPYALSLHLFLEPSEFFLDSGSDLSSSFETKPNTLVVITGKELEEWSRGEIKSAQGKVVFRPFLRTNTPSFSIQQKLKIGVVKSDKIVSVWDQILILLVIALLWKYFSYLFS